MLKLAICPGTPLDNLVTAEMVNVLEADSPLMLHKSQAEPAEPVALSISKTYLPPLFQVAAPVVARRRRCRVKKRRRN